MRILDVSVHVRFCRSRLVLLYRGIHDIDDTVDRNTGLTHLGNHPAKRAYRPGQHGIIGNKSDKGTGTDLSAYAENGAEYQDQHDLQAGNEIARAPEERHQIHQAHPQSGVFLVLRLKTVLLELLPSECAHDTHTGQILLRDGREHTLLHIAFAEPGSDLVVEIHRIQHDDRQAESREDRQLDVHAVHKSKTHNDQDHDTDQRNELLGNEDTDTVHVRGASLDDIAGLVLHVPGEGELLDVRKKNIAHPLHQSLCSLVIH